MNAEVRDRFQRGLRARWITEVVVIAVAISMLLWVYGVSSVVPVKFSWLCLGFSSRKAHLAVALAHVAALVLYHVKDTFPVGAFFFIVMHGCGLLVVFLAGYWIPLFEVAVSLVIVWNSVSSLVHLRPIVAYKDSRSHLHYQGSSLLNTKY